MPSPDNPRREFDPKLLSDLADSLKREGQLQNIVVYQPDGFSAGYTLIAGERRFRAAKLAGLKTLLAMVLDVTDEQAIEMRGAENEDRQNFSAFELARWYQQLQAVCGLSQRAIAKRLGISQGQVGNVLALLKLPAEWEQQAITREISPTCLRHLASWSHRPQVLEAVAEGLKEIEGEVTVSEFREIVSLAVREQSRPLNPQVWNGPLFRVTSARRAVLDVESVSDQFGNQTERAFAVEEWERLNKLARQEKEAVTKAAKAAAKSEANAPAGAAKQEANWEINPRKLARLWSQWFRQSLADQLDQKLAKAKRELCGPLGFWIAIYARDMDGEIEDLWPNFHRFFEEIVSTDFAARMPRFCLAALREDHLWDFWEAEPYVRRA